MKVETLKHNFLFISSDTVTILEELYKTHVKKA
jgi:hypothetical protein